MAYVRRQGEEEGEGKGEGEWWRVDDTRAARCAAADVAAADVALWVYVRHE